MVARVARPFSEVRMSDKHKARDFRSFSRAIRTTRASVVRPVGPFRRWEIAKKYDENTQISGNLVQKSARF